MGGLLADLGGSIARTSGYGRFTRQPWAGQPSKVPRFLVDLFLGQPNELNLSSIQTQTHRVGVRREFARRFVEGIGKLAGYMPGDGWKKTVRLATRMLEVVRFAG
ncbi:hypothetical protein BHM03_00033038, partial [Ensete ventricosum]